MAEIEKVVAFTLLPLKAITPDNGTEFAYLEQLEQITGAEVYFANPYSSWERGLNEHQNGLIRDFYPKKTDFRELSDKKVADVEKFEQSTKKSFWILTPAEAMFNYVTFGTWCT